MQMKPFILALINRARMAPRLGRMLLLSYCMGVYAIMPGILEHAGIPRAVCHGWWMNIFIFHHLLDMLEKGGLIVGTIGILSGFAVQYTLLMVALIVTRRRRIRRTPGSASGIEESQ